MECVVISSYFISCKELKGVNKDLPVAMAKDLRRSDFEVSVGKRIFFRHSVYNIQSEKNSKGTQQGRTTSALRKLKGSSQFQYTLWADLSGHSDWQLL